MGFVVSDTTKLTLTNHAYQVYQHLSKNYQKLTPFFSVTLLDNVNTNECFLDIILQFLFRSFCKNVWGLLMRNLIIQKLTFQKPLQTQPY